MDPNIGSDPSRPPRIDEPPQVPRQALRAPPSTRDSDRALYLNPTSGTSPLSSRHSLQPRTPDAVHDASADYFEPVTRASSVQSRFSAASGRSAARTPSASSEFRQLPGASRRPSIRIRRNSNASTIGGQSVRLGGVLSDAAPGGLDDAARLNDEHVGRRRSSSQPLSRPSGPMSAAGNPRSSQWMPQISMPRLTEEGSRPTRAELDIPESPLAPMSPTMSLPEHPTALDGSQPGSRRPALKGKLSRMFWPGSGKRRQSKTVDTMPDPNDEYDERLVDWLDTIDPEVQALSTLTNVQNSLFIPDLGGWINRRPTYVLSQRDAEQALSRPPELSLVDDRSQGAALGQQPTVDPSQQLPDESGDDPPPLGRSNTITSRLTDSHYAALPHGTTLEGWTAAEKFELDDHVRHMLHSRRARFKRTMKGFGQYVRRPLGFFVTLYATLITLFGLAWVLFLIGWIYVGEEQVYAIHIIDSVLVALFAVMGDGLAPFRAVDTYHTFFVVRYSRMIEKAAKKAELERKRQSESGGSQANIAAAGAVSETVSPPNATSSADQPNAQQQGDGISLEQTTTTTTPNPLRPEREPNHHEEAKLDNVEYLDHSPLTEAQRRSLEHHQTKLAKSHSFYKPHETHTHYPFHLSYLIAIIVLLDCHSCLQISLGACTWGINYHHRPFAITTVILCVSITCNLTAGLVITIGDRKTRKKDVVSLINRQELTEDAMKKMKNRRQDQGKPGNLGEASSDEKRD